MTREHAAHSASGQTTNGDVERDTGLAHAVIAEAARPLVSAPTETLSIESRFAAEAPPATNPGL